MEKKPFYPPVDFEHDGETVHIVTPIESNEIFSIVHVEVCGLLPTVRNDGSETTYTITSGAGIMVIDGVEYELSPGIVITVPRGSEYFAAGTYTAVAMCIPAFDSSTVVLVEKDNL